ncbi:MAG: sugar phosphate isomerase/epimerase [Gemmatimonadota bacterium]|nr:sugar phosphate isomerase/epimerase [Gemmatimonadota bacterium]
MSDRRSFLYTLGSALVGAACARSSSDSDTTASTTQSGQRLDRIGIQLYTVRRDTERDFEGTLARVAEVGYREVEFAGYYGRSANDVRAVLNRVGLTAPSSHVGLPDCRRDVDGVIAMASGIGASYLVVPWLEESERKTLDDYRRIGEELNRIGEKVRAAGMRLGYHNHDFELARIDGRLPLDVLLQEADANLVVLELDLYWAVKGGIDPIAYVAQYPGRIHLVHVKDSAGAPEHRQVDVGKGTINFAEIFARREQAGIRHAFVEHDNPPSTTETMRASYEHLARLSW